MWIMLWINLLGCITKIVDRVTVDRIVGQAKVVGDTQMPCGLGESLNHVLMAAQTKRKTPDLALVISNGTAGICAQQQAWEFHLETERAKKQLPLSNPYRIAAIKDAQYAAARWDAIAARRFYQAFLHAESAFGVMDSPCPTIREKDEVAYLVGLISGTFAVLHDKQSDGQVGVPLDLLPKITRAASCLDNQSWWYVPQALQGGIWATVPGSGPDDVEPWELLKEAAQLGAKSGVRVSYAVGSLLANNAGHTDLMEELLKDHGSSLNSRSAAPDWKFFDQYATEVSLFQSDLLWTSQFGHRTPQLGQLPELDDVEDVKMDEDPFEGADSNDDPFGE